MDVIEKMTDPSRVIQQFGTFWRMRRPIDCDPPRWDDVIHLVSAVLAKWFLESLEIMEDDTRPEPDGLYELAKMYRRDFEEFLASSGLWELFANRPDITRLFWEFFDRRPLAVLGIYLEREDIVAELVRRQYRN